MVDMNAALRAKYQRVVELLSTASIEEVLTRHEVGLVVADIKRGERRYGANAVERLAKALGRPASTLYRYSLVAEQWTREHLAAVLRRRNAEGQPLMWSHFVVLTCCEHRARRGELLERAFAESLSARQLRLLLERAPKRAGTPTAALRRALDRIEAFGEVTVEWSEALGAIDRKPDEQVSELLDRAALSHRRLLEQVQEQLRQIESIRRRVGPPESSTRPVAAGVRRMPLLLAGG